MITEDMGVARFSELLAARLEEWYGDHTVETWGDPAGAARAQTDERTCFDIVREYAGLDVQPAPAQDWTIRREAVAGALNRMVEGEPGLLLSPHCRTLRKGFSGGFHYRRVKVVGDERYHDKPDKNAYSHPHDALQYALLGGGEGRALLKREERDSRMLPAETESRYDEMRF